MIVSLLGLLDGMQFVRVMEQSLIMCACDCSALVIRVYFDEWFGERLGDLEIFLA